MTKTPNRIILTGIGALILATVSILSVHACAHENSSIADSQITRETGTLENTPDVSVESFTNEASPESNPEPVENNQDEIVPEPVVRSVALRIFPQDAQVLDGETFLVADSRLHDLANYSTAASVLTLRAPGYTDMGLTIPSEEDVVSLEAKLEKPLLPVALEIEFPTANQPKSLRFSSDSQWLFAAHLIGDVAISRYSVDPFEDAGQWRTPPEWQRDGGFVETLILRNRRELWVSQMTRNAVHVFDLDSGEWKDAILLEGTWPKVLTATEDESRVFVSCWVSQTVEEIDPGARETRSTWSVSGTPRGLALSQDQETLYATIFSSSELNAIDLASTDGVRRWDAAPGTRQAMRHIVWDSRRNLFYVSAMGGRRVYRFDPDNGFVGSWTVGFNPNTCAISPDGRWLFVSCRGPNNPDLGYLEPGYEYGKVYLIDLDAAEGNGAVLDWIWGRDQCTGLDVSSDGRWLAFSDFLDASIEVYEILDDSSRR